MSPLRRPCAPDAVHVVEHDRGTARGLDALQFLVRKEADEAAVRRPEGHDPTFRAGQRASPSRQSSGRSQSWTLPVSDRLPPKTTRLPSGEMTALFSWTLLGQEDVRSQDPSSARRQTAASAREAEPRRGDDGERRDRPRDALAVAAPRRHWRRRGHARGGSLGDPAEAPCRRRPPTASAPRVLRKAGPDDAVERGRRHGRDLRDRRRLVAQDRGDERRLRRAREGLLSRRHLEEDRAQSEDVRPRVRFPALELLRRHVLEGPEDRALAGQLGLRRQGGHRALRGDRRRPASPGRSRAASRPTSSA